MSGFAPSDTLTDVPHHHPPITNKAKVKNWCRVFTTILRMQLRTSDRRLAEWCAIAPLMLPERC